MILLHFITFGEFVGLNQTVARITQFFKVQILVPSHIYKRNNSWVKWLMPVIPLWEARAGGLGDLRWGVRD